MRILSLLPSATEILFGLGLGDQIVAASHECDYPTEAARLPRATRSAVDSSLPSRQIDLQVQALCGAGSALYELDTELVRALRPDLIVTQSQCDVCAVRYQDVLDLVRREAALDGTRVLALNPRNIVEVLADVGRIASATGTSLRGQAYTRSLDSRVTQIREKTDRLMGDERPRVVCLEWLDPLMAAGNWMPELISLAGGKSGLAAPRQHSGYVCLEAVLDYDPQVLIVSACGFDLPRTIQEAQPLLDDLRWRQIAAFRNDRLYAIDGNAYLNRSGPRIVDSLEMVAHLLHPQLVGRPSWATAGTEPWTAICPRKGHAESGRKV